MVKPLPISQNDLQLAFQSSRPDSDENLAEMRKLCGAQGAGRNICAGKDRAHELRFRRLTLSCAAPKTTHPSWELPERIARI